MQPYQSANNIEFQMNAAITLFDYGSQNSRQKRHKTADFAGNLFGAAPHNSSAAPLVSN